MRTIHIGAGAQLAVRSANGSYVACHLSHGGDHALSDLLEFHASHGQARDLVEGGDVSHLGGLMGAYRCSARMGRPPEPCVRCADDAALAACRRPEAAHLYIHDGGRWRQA